MGVAQPTYWQCDIRQVNFGVRQEDRRRCKQSVDTTLQVLDLQFKQPAQFPGLPAQGIDATDGSPVGSYIVSPS